jgi:hypothetical protein
MMESAPTVGDPHDAKAQVLNYCRRKGALVAGVADPGILDRIAPPGHRPRDLMPRVKSVIALGVGGQTQGAWAVPARAFGFFGSTEGSAYKIAFGCAFFIEQEFGQPSIYCPPDPDPECGTRVPFQSLKLHAEVAGLGARSLAGDILLHPDYGYLYYASVFTELELTPDRPLEINPCPAPSCIDLYRKTGQTPCMKFCPVQCLSGAIDQDGRQQMMRYEMAKCAEMSEQYEAVPGVLADAISASDEAAREHVLFDPDSSVLWYKMSVGSGGLLGQCFECMRACPIATRAPLADPIRRGAKAKAGR